MIKSLQDFFTSKSSKKADPTDKDLKLAAATLMFEVVRSDGDVGKIEMVAMGEILRQQFKLEDDDVKTMLELAKETARDATSLQGFTRDICDKWGNAKRMKLLEHLWVIALADQVIDKDERHLVRKIAGLLYLTEMQIVKSRENAKALLQIEDF